MSNDMELTAGDGHHFQAYCARPKGSPRGGVVVGQEIFGVNAHIREVCDGFAKDGYLALAPAYFDRIERGVRLDYDEEGFTRGRDIRAQIEEEWILHDTAAAIEILETLQKEAAGTPNTPKTAIIGYCWGGSIAWKAACGLSTLACAIGYYGAQIISDVDQIPHCPVMLHFGAKDTMIPLADIKTIRVMHPEVEIFVYDADHGFNCDHRAQFDETAAATARQRTLDMLASHLG